MKKLKIYKVNLIVLFIRLSNKKTDKKHWQNYSVCMFIIRPNSRYNKGFSEFIDNS